MRPRLAFYGSTPAYKVVLDAHGWGDLQPELNRLSKTGDWGDDVGADHRRDRRHVRRRPARPTRSALAPRSATATSCNASRSTPPTARRRLVARVIAAYARQLVARARGERSIVSVGRSRDVVPRHVHDPPARRFDRRDPPAVALPLQAVAVPLEPVALAHDRDTDGHAKSTRYAPIANCGSALGQPARAQQAAPASLRAATPSGAPTRARAPRGSVRSPAARDQAVASTASTEVRPIRRAVLERGFERLAVDERLRSRRASASPKYTESRRHARGRFASASHGAR